MAYGYGGGFDSPWRGWGDDYDKMFDHYYDGVDRDVWEERTDDEQMRTQDEDD